MSRKKHKKRHSSTVSAARAKLRDEQLAEDKARYGNRMNPTARNLLFCDLIFLAACQILYSQGMLSELASGIMTLISIGVLILALYFQFGKKKSGGSGSSWPM